MTPKQRDLVVEHGPKFCSDKVKVFDQIISLLAEGTSILTSNELDDLTNALNRAVDELNRAQSIVVVRMKEAGLPVQL